MVLLLLRHSNALDSAMSPDAGCIARCPSAIAVTPSTAPALPE